MRKIGVYSEGSGALRCDDRYPQYKGFPGRGTVWCSGQDTSRVPESFERRRMSVSVSIPDELYQKAVEIAEAQNVSVDEMFALAFVEQLSGWERLQVRAARGTRAKFLAVLDKVADREPDQFDRL